MRKSEFRQLQELLRENDEWFCKNDGKFAAFSADGDLLATENDLEVLFEDVAKRYALAGTRTIIFAKVSAGAFVRIADSRGLSRSAWVQ